MKLYRLQAFPNGENGGNKAGVVVEADQLTDQEMQQIAAEVGYSETAFVTKSKQADVKVRFFSPRLEVDLCGHATIATFNLMRDEKYLSSGQYTQETKAGILRLDVQEDMVFMEQNPPQFFETVEPEEVLDCFVEDDFLDTRLPIQIVSTGLKEIFLPVKSVKVLHELTPNHEAIEALSKKHDVIGIHVFSIADDADVYGRNFAPGVGIMEESATGTSNGALSCYLAKYVIQKEQYRLRQGYSMNQPSEIHVTLTYNKGTIQEVWVGGTAQQVKE